MSSQGEQGGVSAAWGNQRRGVGGGAAAAAWGGSRNRGVGMGGERQRGVGGGSGGVSEEDEPQSERGRR
jgi:hypothetical protein